MFDMTNDSGLFHSRQRLTEDGYYPVEGTRWRKGEQEFVPLYVGRMIHQFDHRAASVEVNAENLHNPALSDRVSRSEEHTSELQSLMRISYAVFCLKKKKTT